MSFLDSTNHILSISGRALPARTWLRRDPSKQSICRLIRSVQPYANGATYFYPQESHHTREHYFAEACQIAQQKQKVLQKESFPKESCSDDLSCNAPQSHIPQLRLCRQE